MRSLTPNNILISGGLAIGVPGEVKGYYRAWREFGQVEWSQLFKPSIDLARNGFPIGKHLHNAINFVNHQDIQSKLAGRELEPIRYYKVY